MNTSKGAAPTKRRKKVDTMMTRKSFFENVLSLSLSDEMNEFATHQLEILNRPRAKSSTPTAKQKENEIIKQAIIITLRETDKPLTVDEIRANIQGELSVQRVSALLSQLVKAEQIVRIEGKGKAKVTFTVNRAE